jgi:signal transduction histidine kinase
MSFKAVNLSLRLRVAMGFALLCVLVSLALGGWVYLGSRDLEHRLIDEALAAELEDYRSRLTRNPQSPPPLTATVRGYLETATDASNELPQGLIGLGPGYHSLEVDGVSYRVAVALTGKGRLYMLHSRAQVESREQRLMVRVLLGILAIVLCSAAGGWWLAGLVIAPVAELARRVRERDATQSGHSLTRDMPEDEVGELAQVFELQLKRMRAFVERERAFSADASHELRTPLAVMQGALEILQADQGLVSNNGPLLARMARALRGMTDLTTTLLMLARERPGALPQAPVCQLADVLRDVIEQHQGLLQHKAVELRLELEAQPQILVERPLLAIALGNLVRNAFAYTESGWVEIRLLAQEVLVTDTGPGIPAAEISCLFEHCSQSRRTTRGAGIGLPLVKRIADRQGWQISVTSQEGQGACFQLKFDF